MDRILVVDDNAVNRKLLSVLLQAEGYEVLTAERAESVARHFARRPPKLVLVDVRLPGIDGLELTRRLREGPGGDALVIIAVTADASEREAERARLAGCDDFVAKPIDTRSLPRLIERHLRARSGAASAPPPGDDLRR